MKQNFIIKWEYLRNLVLNNFPLRSPPFDFVETTLFSTFPSYFFLPFLVSPPHIEPAVYLLSHNSSPEDGYRLAQSVFNILTSMFLFLTSRNILICLIFSTYQVIKIYNSLLIYIVYFLIWMWHFNMWIGFLYISHWKLQISPAFLMWNWEERGGGRESFSSEI